LEGVKETGRPDGPGTMTKEDALSMMEKEPELKKLCPKCGKENEAKGTREKVAKYRERNGLEK
jgi:hypothetical protein